MKGKVRVTKEFNFEMAHALLDYDGLCKNIHGHSYKLFVTVIGSPIEDEKNTKEGMVMDFGDLKRIVKPLVVDIFDHSVVLNKKAPTESFIQVRPMFERIHLLDYQPTCENMVIDFAGRIKPLLPENVELFRIKLYETATSFAEWYASDND
ncbi:MAG: 6-carboxytetrahydropterin synthase [Bacteroidales bacterium]|nr:6-carboxytetrahydropterin synthase [Bacteroidales bacterium]